jgi:hypothetical protein
VNLTPREPILDLPAEHVAQIIIVHERSPTGKIKRSTALMRTSEIELRRMADRLRLEAMPTYWCPRGDGRIEVWPAPIEAYDAEIMGIGGRPLGGSARRPVEVPTVQAFATAINQSYDAQQRSGQVATQRIERFTLARDDE